MSPTPEVATLGALVWNPGAVPGVRGWLAGTDFADPWHTHVYRALLEYPTPGTPVTVGLALRDRLGPRLADLPRFAALVGDTPPRPDAIAYARLVLEASLAREITTYGLVLRAGALATRAHRTPDSLHQAVGHVRGWADQAQGRWQAAHDGQAVGFDPDAAAAARHRVLLGADRYLATHPTPTPADAATAEGWLVGALLSHPHRLRTAAGISSDQLSTPLAAAALTAVRDLAQVGAHVDPVTVTALLTRTGAGHAGQAAASLEQWAHQGGIRDLDHLVVTVLAHTSITTAVEADRAFRGAGPGSPTDWLGDVHAHLDQLGALAGALTPIGAPTRSRLTLAPPPPRTRADDTFVLEVG